MKKNLNKTISQLIILVIIFLSIFILFEYFTNKKISKNKLIKITITNSIPSSLMTSYFKINLENSKFLKKYNLTKIDDENYTINFTAIDDIEIQKIKNEFLNEIDFLKNSISDDIIGLINLNKYEFLQNSEMSVLYSIITKGKDFISYKYKQTEKNMHSNNLIKYFYYFIISLIISLLILLISKQLNSNKKKLIKIIN